MDTQEPFSDHIDQMIQNVRNAEQERKAELYKNLPSYLWTGFIAVIEVAVVWSILGGLYGSENVLMAGIVIVYAYVRSTGAGMSLVVQGQGLALANEIYQIKNKLEISQDEDAMDKLKEGNRLYRKQQMNSIIQSIGLLVLLVLSVWSIFSSL